MMPSNYVNLIKYFEGKSMIRDYCDCTLALSKAYNEAIPAYSQFLFLHQSFIRKFMLGQSEIKKNPQDLKISGLPQ